MTARRPLPRSAAGAIIALLALVVLAADQFVKHLTITHLPEGELVPVLGDFFSLQFVRNSGAAFSLGSGVTWIFTIALAAVAVVIGWLAFRVRSRLWAVVLGAVLGGVLGNLGDRLFREPGFGQGHVVDMIWMPWIMPGAIFNVADVFIVTGMISLALLVVIGIRLDGTRERSRKAPAGDDPADEVDPADDADVAPDAPEDARTDAPPRPAGASAAGD